MTDAHAARKARLARARDYRYITYLGRRYRLRIRGWHLGLYASAEAARQARDRFLARFAPRRAGAR